MEKNDEEITLLSKIFYLLQIRVEWDGIPRSQCVDQNRNVQFFRKKSSLLLGAGRQQTEDASLHRAGA